MAEFLNSIVINTQAMIWMFVLVCAICIEACTASLVSIWFAAGAIVALMLCFLEVSMAIQILAFLIVSLILIIAVRPLYNKFMAPHIEKTNLDAVVGKQGRVTEAIDNFESTGAVYIAGKEWTARSKLPGIIEKDSTVNILAIQGVKLIVEKVQNEESK